MDEAVHARKLISLIDSLIESSVSFVQEVNSSLGAITYREIVRPVTEVSDDSSDHLQSQTYQRWCQVSVVYGHKIRSR